MKSFEALCLVPAFRLLCLSGLKLYFFYPSSEYALFIITNMYVALFSKILYHVHNFSMRDNALFLKRKPDYVYSSMACFVNQPTHSSGNSVLLLPRTCRLLLPFLFVSKFNHYFPVVCVSETFGED